MTRLVVDASVAIKWYLPESDSELAHRILVAPVSLFAPGLLRLEIANGLWKNWRKKLVSAEQIDEALASVERAIGTWRDSAALLEVAVKLSVSLNHVLYDCIYLALAQNLGAPLVSADKQLLGIAPAGLAIALEDWRP